jgi:hypothetical protein
MFARLGLALLIGPLAIAGCGSVHGQKRVGLSPSHARAAKEHLPAGINVTPGGRLLVRFEGLLHSEFGSKAVCERAVKPGRPAVFVANGCTPLADYDPFFYSFRHSSAGNLHLSHKQPRHFGNYPRVINIRRETVRCDSGDTPKYLITYSDAASFTLACQAPQK